MSILEAGMMICFGASWPFQVAKTYKTKEVKGKSILFLWLVETGYILGMLHHLLYAPDKVIWLYLLNFLLVGSDMILYYKYKNNREVFIMSDIKKIGVLTSGGDAPGMNAAIRSVVRTAINKEIKVVGIHRGFEGLLHGDIEELGARNVSNILNRGGTILYTARSEEMRTPEGVEKAAQVCKILQLDALVIIGGNGSLAGGLDLSKHGINIMGIPGTIDLDLDCSEYTIGFDTAVNTSMDAINKIRDTSCSHERCSVVEVMGRNAGYIALWTGLANGAEEILVPEDKITMERVVEQILENRSRGKNHNLIIVAEGVGMTQQLAEYIESVTGIQTRATILGHLQRGGSPTAKDRIAAAIMGYNAVDAIIQGKQNRIMIVKDGQYTDIDLEEGLKYKRPYDDSLYHITKFLAI